MRKKAKIRSPYLQIVWSMLNSFDIYYFAVDVACFNEHCCLIALVCVYEEPFSVDSGQIREIYYFFSKFFNNKFKTWSCKRNVLVGQVTF